MLKNRGLRLRRRFSLRNFSSGVRAVRIKTENNKAGAIKKLWTRFHAGHNLHFCENRSSKTGFTSDFAGVGLTLCKNRCIMIEQAKNTFHPRKGEFIELWQTTTALSTMR